MSRNRPLLDLTIAVAAIAGTAFVGATPGNAQDNPHMNHAQHMRAIESAVPTLPGQDAFGTIQEIVRMLEADPTTDWSKVNIAALREHLIDMNEVTLRAVATEQVLDNGIQTTVTGQGRTRDAIKRMVPAHTHELAAIGWNATVEDLPNGVKLVVTSADPKQAVKLKALGFMGIMVQGSHHQPHHLMMARGEFTH
jgi:NAD(P)H-dependent flavin oxidoreductase YrpB (nitropropane dioxygenase family)